MFAETPKSLKFLKLFAFLYILIDFKNVCDFRKCFCFKFCWIIKKSPYFPNLFANSKNVLWFKKMFMSYKKMFIIFKKSGSQTIENVHQFQKIVRKFRKFEESEKCLRIWKIFIESKNKLWILKKFINFYNLHKFYKSS